MSGRPPHLWCGKLTPCCQGLGRRSGVKSSYSALFAPSESSFHLRIDLGGYHRHDCQPYFSSVLIQPRGPRRLNSGAFNTLKNADFQRYLQRWGAVDFEENPSCSFREAGDDQQCHVGGKLTTRNVGAVTALSLSASTCPPLLIHPASNQSRFEIRFP